MGEGHGEGDGEGEGDSDYLGDLDAALLRPERQGQRANDEARRYQVSNYVSHGRLLLSALADCLPVQLKQYGGAFQRDVLTLFFQILNEYASASLATNDVDAQDLR